MNETVRNIHIAPEQGAQPKSVDLEPGTHRRNITTEGIPVTHLIDRRIQVGHTVCLGTELREPRSYLERHLEQNGVREALVPREGCAVGSATEDESASGTKSQR